MIFVIVILSIVVVVAFLGNALVVYVLLVRRKLLLTKPYSIFILNLAFVDCITAIFLVFSRFMYTSPIPTYSQAAADAFCKTVWGTIPFTLGYISIYNCLALTIERWLAVVKPHVYRTLKRRHAIYTLIFVWLSGFAVNLTVVLRLKYSVVTKNCQFVPIPGAESKLVWVDFFLQSLLPMSIMVALYCYMYFSLKKLPRVASGRNSQLRKITLVGLTACSAIIIGWLPGRITFLLAKFRILSIYGPVSMTCTMLSFFNSCVNPFLYGICSPIFREEYKLVFRKLVAICYTERRVSEADNNK